MNWLMFIFVGIVSGWIAGKLWKGKGFGLVGNLVVGVIGALVGGLVFGLLNISAGGVIGGIVMSVVGALVLLYVVNLFAKP